MFEYFEFSRQNAKNSIGEKEKDLAVSIFGLYFVNLRGGFCR